MTAVPTAAALLGMKGSARDALHKSSLAGLPVSAFDKFVTESGLEANEVAEVIALPARTLARRPSAGKLSPDESDKLVRFTDLYRKTLDFFVGRGSDANAWLRQKRPALGGYRPIDLARTADGTRQVETLISQLQHGIIV